MVIGVCCIALIVFPGIIRNWGPDEEETPREEPLVDMSVTTTDDSKDDLTADNTLDYTSFTENTVPDTELYGPLAILDPEPAPTETIESIELDTKIEIVPEPEIVITSTTDESVTAPPETTDTAESETVEITKPAPEPTKSNMIDLSANTTPEPIASETTTTDTAQNTIPEPDTAIEIANSTETTPPDISMSNVLTEGVGTLDTAQPEIISPAELISPVEANQDIEPDPGSLLAMATTLDAMTFPVTDPSPAGSRRSEASPVSTNATDGRLHGTVTASYVSRYIWRGYDAYPSDHSAFQPSIDLDLFQTGFGLNIWNSTANGSGFVNDEWLIYTPYYKTRLFQDATYATNLKIGYSYFNYPDTPRRGTTPGNGDAQEVFAMMEWPVLLGGKVVPYYAAFAYWSSESNAMNRNNSGWAHVVGLGYDLNVPALENPIHLDALAVYNDGVGPAGSLADHDWSHAVFSISTDFQIAENLLFTPGFHYQSSWDDSINKSDEYWTSLDLVYKF